MNIQRRISSIATTMAILILSFPVSAQVGWTPLSDNPAPMRDILKSTYLHNPALEAQRAQRRATGELENQADALFRPSVQAGAGMTKGWDDVDGFNDDYFSRDVSINLTQPLYRGGRSMARSDEAAALDQGARYRLDAVENDVFAQSVIRTLFIVENVALVALEEENRTIAARLDRMIAAMRDAGETGSTDVELATARLARAETSLISAQAARDDAMRAFEETTGYPAAPWTHVPLNIRPPLSTDPGYAARIASTNPDVLAAATDVSAEEARVRIASGERLPTVNAVAGMSHEWDGGGNIDHENARIIGLRATMPLYEGGALTSRLRQARHIAARQRHEHERINLGVIRDAESALIAYRTADATMVTSEKESRAAEFARRGVETEMLAGEKTLSDLLQADRDWIDAKRAYLRARYARDRAAVRLAALGGHMNAGTLGLAPAVGPHE